MRFKGQKDEFESLHRVGAGGMAEVLFGRSVADPQRAVAIKVPLPDLAPEVRALFLREATAAQKVEDARVVRVVDFGDNPPFIAYEFVDAPTLGKELAARAQEARPMNVGEFVRLAFDLIGALEAINRVVVHRDVKPDNVFVTSTGVRVSDFGIAKFLGEATRTSTFKQWGTTVYMAPELLVDESGSPLSDQYAVGVTLYEAAVLALPFIAGNTDELIRQIKYTEPRHLSAVAKTIPHAIGSVVMRMMSKAKAARFPTWLDARRALESAISDTGVASVEVVDPLIDAAIRRLEAKTAAELAEKKRHDDLQREWRERQDLAAYWLRWLLDAFQARVDAINRSLPKAAVTLVRRESPVYGAGFEIRFLDNVVEVAVEPVSAGLDKDVLVTGYLVGSAGKMRIVTHLLVLRSGDPYGSALEAGLKIAFFVHDPRRAVRDAPKGANFEVFADVVLARNALALLHERQYRNATHTVNYDERPFDLSGNVTAFMEFVVRSASGT